MRIARYLLLCILINIFFLSRGSFADHPETESIPELGSTKRLFFRWGNESAHRELLLRGGVVLGGGESATLNESVLDRLRAWYVEGGRVNVAGPGFYLCSNPYSSSESGKDLLVVEIELPKVTVDGRQIITVSADFEGLDSGVEIKNKAEVALSNGSFENLPLITQYTKVWYVVSRALLPNEIAQGFRIKFRSPTADDAKAYWQMALRDDYGLVLLNKIASIWVQSEKNERSMRLTHTAEKFLERILFEEGSAALFDYLEKRQGDSDDLSDSIDLSASVLAYATKFPKSEMTNTLLRRWWNMERVRPRTALVSDSTLELAVHLFPLLSIREREDAFSNYNQWISRKISSVQNEVELAVIFDFIRTFRLQLSESAKADLASALLNKARRLSSKVHGALRILQFFLEAELELKDLSLTNSRESFDEILSLIKGSIKPHMSEPLRVIAEIERLRSSTRGCLTLLEEPEK